MKTIFTFLGKAVVLILYWALVALSVWSFYDEYIAEQRRSSICMGIAIFFLACAYHSMFIAWLYKPELKQIEQKHPKTYNILSDVSVIISCIFLGISVIIFFCALIVPILGCYTLSIISVIRHYWEFGLLITLLFIAGVIRKKINHQWLKLV